MSKRFWDNADGLSIQDIIALGAFVAWLGMSAAFGWFAIIGTLTPVQVDFYSTFIFLPTTVVGGVFGVRAVGGIVRQRQRNQSDNHQHWGEDVDVYENFKHGPPI